MELRNLYYFIQVCEDRNYSVASSKLFITQQALSKSIKSLEAELGAVLFTKTPGGMTLTPFAESIYPICKDMITHYEAGLHKIHSISKEGKIPIRVASAYQTIDTLSFTLVEDFKKSYPEIDLVSDGFPDLMAEKEILEGKADFLLSIGLPQRKELFESFLIREIPLCVMVGPCHPLYEKDILDIRDLDMLDLHCAGPQFKTYHLLKQKSNEAGIMPNLIPTSGHLYSTYKNIFENNRAIIGLVGTNQEPEFNNIKRIPFDDPELNWNIYFNYLKDKSLSPQEETFLHTILNYRKI